MSFSSCCSCATCSSRAAFFGALLEAEALLADEGWFAEAVLAEDGWLDEALLAEAEGWFAVALTAGWFAEACFDLSDAADESWLA